MIGEVELCMMKLDVVLINILCGGFIDEDVLVWVMIVGYLVGVGLDVMEIELLFVDYLLCGFDWVIFILYILGYIIDFYMVMFDVFVENVICIMKGGLLIYVRNFDVVECW